MTATNAFYPDRTEARRAFLLVRRIERACRRIRQALGLAAWGPVCKSRRQPPGILDACTFFDILLSDFPNLWHTAALGQKAAGRRRKARLAWLTKLYPRRSGGSARATGTCAERAFSPGCARA